MSNAPLIVPDYTDTVTADPSYGRHDKIMVDMDGWTGTGSPEAFAEFRANLAGVFHDDNGIEYRLFNSPGGHLHPATVWRISAGLPTGEGNRRKPLFSGKLEARVRNVVSASGERTWDFTFRLALNPTRWIAQQPLNLVRVPDAEWAEEPVRMFHRGEQNFTFDEIGLVRSDNVHVGLPRIMNIARPSVWMLQVSRYLRGVIALLGSTLSAASQEGSGFVVNTEAEPSFTLKEIEANWEYHTPRPLEEMRRIADPIRRLAASSTTAWFPLAPQASEALSQNGSIEVGTDDNSPRILMRAGTGYNVRIYAKTSARLRFEVAYDCTDARQMFQPLTGLNTEQLLSRLDHARYWGSHTINEVLTFIRPHVAVPAHIRGMHELFAEIFLCATSPAAASAMVSMLVTNGRIATGEGISVGLRDIRRLVRRGVLVRGGMQGRDYTWVVSPPYEAALANLRASQT